MLRIFGGPQHIVFYSSHTLVVWSAVEELNLDFSKLNTEVILEGELQHYLSALAIQALYFEEILSSQR